MLLAAADEDGSREKNDEHEHVTNVEKVDTETLNYYGQGEGRGLLLMDVCIDISLFLVIFNLVSISD